MSTAPLPICPACNRPVANPSTNETLNVYASTHTATRRLLDAVGYSWPNTLHAALVCIHMACLEKYQHAMADHHKVAYQSWKIRQLEAANRDIRTEMQRICQAIEVIAPDVYFRFIETPALSITGAQTNGG